MVSCEIVDDCREDEEACADFCQAALAAGGDGILDNLSASVGTLELDEREGGREAAIISHAEGVRSTRDASNCGPTVNTTRGGRDFDALVTVACIVDIRRPWRLATTPP